MLGGFLFVLHHHYHHFEHIDLNYVIGAPRFQRFTANCSVDPAGQNIVQKWHAYSEVLSYSESMHKAPLNKRSADCKGNKSLGGRNCLRAECARSPSWPAGSWAEGRRDPPSIAPGQPAPEPAAQLAART